MYFELQMLQSTIPVVKKINSSIPVMLGPTGCNNVLGGTELVYQLIQVVKITRTGPPLGLLKVILMKAKDTE